MERIYDVLSSNFKNKFEIESYEIIMYYSLSYGIVIDPREITITFDTKIGYTITVNETFTMYFLSEHHIHNLNKFRLVAFDIIKVNTFSD